MQDTQQITNNQDTIDSRDIIARIEYLEGEIPTAGSFDGLRGLEIEMTPEQARSASHQGHCDEDVACLLRDPGIAKQFDALDPDEIRAGLKEVGAWNADELADDEQNRHRALWLAACDMREKLDDLEDKIEELNALRALAEEAEGYAVDWKYGATLIRESYFEQYAEELAEGIGVIPRDLQWPFTCIDWAEAGEQLKQDYAEVSFDGVTYYVR